MSIHQTSTLSDADLEHVTGGGARRYVEQGEGSINTIEINGCAVTETIDAGAYGVFKAIVLYTCKV